MLYLHTSIHLYGMVFIKYKINLLLSKNGIKYYFLVCLRLPQIALESYFLQILIPMQGRCRPYLRYINGTFLLEMSLKKSAWSTEEHDVLLAQFTNTSTWWLVEFSQRPQGKSTAPTQNLYLAHLTLLSSRVTLTAHGFHGTNISLQHCNEDRVFTLTTTNSFIHSPEIFEHRKT